MTRNMLALCGTLVLFACGSSGGTAGPVTEYKTYSFSQTADSIPIRYGETVRVEGVLLTFFALISDTRCAAQAQCVAPGDAEIEIFAAPGCYPQCLAPSQSFRLHVYQAPRTAVYSGKRLTLTWLLPLPPTPNAKPDPKQYVAWLKVEPVS
ncbi:MAG: hypothetical protein U0164_24030 [Gemmatimonadaceae bacterium]